jgi:hypothetical protein
MEMSLTQMGLLILLGIYVVFIPVFYYILTSKEKIIDLIIASRSPRNRPMLIAVKKNAKKDIILAFFWPFLLMRGERHVDKKKR